MDATWVYARRTARLALGAAALIWNSTVFAFTVNVIDPGGNALPGFRWLVEEDATFAVPPGVSTTATQSLGFHRSYMPVAATGESDTASAVIDVPADKRYFVSILPRNGHTQSGRPVAINQDTVTVTVNPFPVPTAQISVFAFEDTFPINNAPNLPQEQGLGGFDILISDMAGHVTKDAFGNPLGTTYATGPDGNPVLDPDGNPVVARLGTNFIRTLTAAEAADPALNPHGLNAGEALVKYLPPGKYGVKIVPPAGSGWQQTATIEGTPTVDAWVKANEPPFFIEFGPPGHHVFIGFVRAFNAIPAPAPGGAAGTLTGQVVNLHNSRPPVYTFHAGHPLPNCWVGLNEIAGRGLYAQPCNGDSTFTIPNVPPGQYQLVSWDTYLDNIFAFHTVTVPDTGGDVNVGPVPVFRWFGAQDHYVFMDNNQNGFPDAGETGIPEQAVNLRFRDGTIYQSFPTDTTGYVPFDEVFPFFNWLVAEVDFARFKATGVTVVADAGGPVTADAGWNYPSYGKLTPQPQAAADGTPLINPNTGNNLSRTETGPVLTQAFQSFLGTTSVFHWGKAPYAPGENGGISGIVHYATTRAENDPRYAAAENWEPGIPRVQVNLYPDAGNGAIADVDGDGVIELADVDNYPVGWAAGGEKGVEDVKRNGPAAGTHDPTLVFDAGDAINVVHTDSWDDNLPTGCPGDPTDLYYLDARCYDGLRNFVQVRDGVFDGGYAFMSHYPGGVKSGTAEVGGLPAGSYVIEAVAPAGYQHVKEEDKNVDFGEAYIPSLLALPPVCVGEGHLVPDNLALFPGVPGFYAGQTRPLCDRKQMLLTDGKNAAVDFFLFTGVPVAGHVVGFVLNDLANEFDANRPTFGEKAAPPWIPISIRDYTGREISRVYSDENGVYNALVPSTFTMNRPSPSGVSPNMLTLCLNSPGPIPDPNNPAQLIIDPYFQRQYTQFCYTFNFIPGTTTYLDTPVLPIAAFTSPGPYPLDCELPAGTPMIHSVSGPQGGPYVSAAGATLTLVSTGTVDVPNPAYDPARGTPKTIARDFGFGTTPGSVTIGGVPLLNVTWSEGLITGEVAPGTTTGQLEVTRGDNGLGTVTGVTVTVGPATVVQVTPGGSIQAAIDAAEPGSLVLVPPGIYMESVILWKDVQLQGWGPGSTVINAANAPAEKLAAWRNKARAIVDSGQVSLLPGQPTAGVTFAEPGLFQTEEGSAILVLAPQTGFTSARVDGFTVTGGDNGGGIVVNGYASSLRVSNNRVLANQGVYGGGVRLGHPYLTDAGGAAVSALNTNAVIDHNQVIENGSLGTPGGGVALYNGADGYRVSENFICGNFSQGDGGGVGHFGRSHDGLIANNRILFNQGFEQTAASGGAGGGILIAGLPNVTGVSAGSGSVAIVGNLIQGNNAGSGDGGGIAARFVNGADVEASPANSAAWDALTVFNNLIVNNVSGLAGGGIALQDVAKGFIINDTVAHNDSTATAGAAFAGNPNQSTAQPAGIVARAHSAALAAVLAGSGGTGPEYAAFSNPVLDNNIVWQNRSFYWNALLNGGRGGFIPDVPNEAPVFADLAVLGTAGQLTPYFSILTDTTGYDASNSAANPNFVLPYFNAGRETTLFTAEPTTAMRSAAAFDEGGNYIDVSYGPLTLGGDYHLQAGSPAIDNATALHLATFTALAADIDGEVRPMDGDGDGIAVVDRGADELTGTPGSANNAPVIASAPVTLASVGVAYTYQVVAQDPDLGIQLLSHHTGALAFALDVAPPGMTISPTGLIQWLPTAADVGARPVTVRVTDQTGLFAQQSFTLTVGVANQAPVAQSETIRVDTQSLFVLPAPGVLANDSDGNGDALSAVQQSNVQRGSATLNADGSLSYSPQEEWVGTETFTYLVSDGALRSNVATVTLVKELVAKEVVFKNEGGNKPQEWVIKGKSAQPGSTLTLYVGALPGGTVIGTTVVSQNGSFTFRDRRTTVFPDGSLRISITSSTGNRLIDLPVTVEGTQPAPAAAAVTSGLRLSDSVTIDRAQYDPVKRQLTVAGNTAALTTVTITLADVTLGTAEADGQGNWTFSANELHAVAPNSVLRVDSLGGGRTEQVIETGGDK